MKNRYNVLHVISRQILDNKYHGAYKDVISRVHFLQNNDMVVYQSCIPEELKNQQQFRILLKKKTHVLIEYTYHGTLAMAIRKHDPTIAIAVRSHNIEPLQHLDNYGWWPEKGPLWMFYGMSRLFLQDLKSKKFSTAFFSINSWENEVYWNLLPGGRSKVKWLPYYCPDHMIKDQVCSNLNRKRIACVPTSQKNRKSLEMVNKFLKFVQTMKGNGSKYEFVITGKIDKWELPKSSYVKMTGFIDDLPSFLNQCKAVAMLSPLGFGLKTTMVDALASGVGVIAHPDLLKRCPDSVRKMSFGLDSNGFDFEKVNMYLDRIDTEQAVKLNSDFRERNHKILYHWLVGSE